MARAAITPELFVFSGIVDIVEACRSQGVPVFVKQMGENVPMYDFESKKGDRLEEMPEAIRFRQYPVVGEGA